MAGLVSCRFSFLFQRKTRTIKPRVPVELGTEKNDVDYEWLPKEMLQELSKYFLSILGYVGEKTPAELNPTF